MCPDWCTISPEQHASEHWNTGGVCLHQSADVEIVDPTGFQEALDDAPRPWRPAVVRFSPQTRPDNGRETATPVFFLHDEEFSLEQLVCLADARSGPSPYGFDVPCGGRLPLGLAPHDQDQTDRRFSTPRELRD